VLNREEIFQLDHQVAIVTGAGKGLGKVMADALALFGAQVIIADINSQLAEVTALEINQQRKVKTKSIQVDVTQKASVESMVKEIAKDFNHVDILVNCAGITRRGNAQNMSEADWDDVIAVNLKGTFLCCQAVGRIMIDQLSGKIINIASMLAFQGGIRVSSYTASKSGVMGITRLLANEWAKHNINVNAIAPTR